MKKAKRLFRRIWKIIKYEEMRILPGQLAFFIVLSIFSIFPLFGLIGSNFISNELITSTEETLPSGISTILKSLMDVSSSGFNVVFFFAFSVYVASNGCGAMIITSNFIYKIKNNNVVKQKIKAIFMTFVLMFLILFIVIVPAFGQLIISLINSHYPGKIIETISSIYHILKYPLSFVLIFICVKILYTMAPDERISSKYNNYGTLFTTFLWIMVTRIYAIYLNNINTYNIFYGSLANVAIMLFWIYILAYIFTLGLALNYDVYYQCQHNVNKKENSIEKNT